MCNNNHSVWNKLSGFNHSYVKYVLYFTIVFEINVVVAKHFNVKYVSYLP
jgi:hypothetical protein